MEANLLPRVADGDESAVSECIERYGNLIWALANRLLRSRSDAEDAVQEIFIEIWKNADRFRPEFGSEKTFVVVIARRRLIDRQRKNARGAVEQPIDEAALSQPDREAPCPVDTADEVQRALSCLDKLRIEYRRMLELAIFHGLSQTQISNKEGVPLGTVKSNARRGLIQLRDCMGPTGG